MSAPPTRAGSFQHAFISGASLTEEAPDANNNHDPHGLAASGVSHSLLNLEFTHPGTAAFPSSSLQPKFASALGMLQSHPAAAAATVAPLATMTAPPPKASPPSDVDASHATANAQMQMQQLAGLPEVLKIVLDHIALMHERSIAAITQARSLDHPAYIPNDRVAAAITETLDDAKTAPKKRAPRKRPVEVTPDDARDESTDKRPSKKAKPSHDDTATAPTAAAADADDDDDVAEKAKKKKERKEKRDKKKVEVASDDEGDADARPKKSPKPAKEKTAKEKKALKPSDDDSDVEMADANGVEKPFDSGDEQVTPAASKPKSKAPPGAPVSLKAPASTSKATKAPAAAAAASAAMSDADDSE